MSVVVCVAGMTPAAARAMGTGTNMTLSLSPSILPADGQSTSLATATVTDASGAPVNGDLLVLGGGQTMTPVPQANGTYTASITATTTPGRSTITATDKSSTSNGSPLSASATLTQSGPAADVVVSLAPSQLTADGASTTVATAQVFDNAGNPVPNDSVAFSASGGQAVGATQTSGTGSYVATITSTRAAGSYTVTATDALGNSGSATLSEVPGPPAVLNLSPFSPTRVVANGVSSAAATLTLTDVFGNAIAGQSVVATSSDSGDRVSVIDVGGGRYGITVISSRTARAAWITITAAGLTTAQALDQVPGPAGQVSVALSPNILFANGISTSTATVLVTDASGNPISGDSIRLVATRAGVHIGRTIDHGGGVYTASITSSNHPTSVTLTAIDTTATPPVSGQATLTEIPAPSLVSIATMLWSFTYTPRYTLMRLMLLNGAPVGARVLITCHGQSCPFSLHSMAVKPHKQCGRRARNRRCHAVSSYDLAAPFRGRRLKNGTSVTVKIVRPGWIGKYYLFRVRASNAPLIRISCLAPGGTRPGVGCQ